MHVRLTQTEPQWLSIVLVQDVTATKIVRNQTNSAFVKDAVAEENANPNLRSAPWSLLQFVDAMERLMETNAVLGALELTF